ncbi:hypothetical protein AVEN_259930-1 [Araneus ventricosus]|uniref:Uncharacterized protein n=1 Tax=Araneus ventricosus TaxID=182803 RepID=A0A4Y2GPM7_ARAVE|nr:hypothetical protein AVEN_259930-1 [Araneus ventricosus]
MGNIWGSSPSHYHVGYSLCVPSVCSMLYTKEVPRQDSLRHIPNEMKTEEVISEDFDNHMQEMHAAIQHTSMAQNMLNIVWSEKDYHTDIASVPERSYIE